MNSIEELKKELENKTLSVKWKILSEIGPDWIGSSRTITFYLDNAPLEDNAFCKQMTDKLIEVIEIPSTSEDHVITGEGTFVLQGADLLIEYQIEAAIPYDYNFDYDSDIKTFMANL
ncbi:hypothetical protein ACFSJW_04775 [Flavobacterium artemisiae]|uniref:Immunity protein 53 n=1 Tax=Flavobacterium artemisiae TaxID=2126556 RepID=A0ABW4HKR3_9FLAO